MDSMTFGAQTAGVQVRLEHLWKRYGNAIPAVRDVNLTIDPGEFITLLGPSGSGKSTTLMMIAGFILPSEGEIHIDGRPVAKLPPQRRDVGMVFQSYALFPHMTVAKNVAFPLEIRRRPRAEIEERVARALENVKLTGFEGRYPRELSGGQQQRVALARAIVFEPRVLLMDEPLGALDRKLREHMQIEIKHIQDRLGITVVYVTHDQEEALTMSDRIAVMQDGVIEQVGPPNELYDAPATAFVADFLGESNLLHGRIRNVANDQTAEVCADDGLCFIGSADTKVESGAVVRACIRPERLRLLSAGQADGQSANRWPGTVEEVIYLGEATKYRVQVSGRSMSVKRQNDGSQWHPSVGDEVLITCAPSDVRMLAN